MKYLVIHQKTLTIFDQCEIPIPLSHLMTESEARQFARDRRLMHEDWRNAQVVPESKFRMFGGRV